MKPLPQQMCCSVDVTEDIVYDLICEKYESFLLKPIILLQKTFINPLESCASLMGACSFDASETVQYLMRNGIIVLYNV